MNETSKLFECNLLSNVWGSMWLIISISFNWGPDTKNVRSSNKAREWCKPDQMLIAFNGIFKSIGLNDCIGFWSITLSPEANTLPPKN